MSTIQNQKNDHKPYWIVHIHPLFLKELSVYDDTDIYAYTENKKYIKEFKNTRNMEKFYIEKIYLTKDQYHDLNKDVPSLYLMEMICKTHTNGPGSQTIDSCFIVTRMESIVVNNTFLQQLTVRSVNTPFVDPMIFNKKIREILDSIGYTRTVNRMREGLFCDIEPDYLSIFIHLYKDILK